MSDLRDYEEWHRAYDDPDSPLSWRLRTVRALIEQALDRHPGPIRVLSACAGDGRDVLGVLAERADAARVTATLLEIHPAIAARARARAAATDAAVEVRVADAGASESYRGAIPADLVILVGIFGNISETDLRTTIAAAPGLCQPGGTLLWSRGRVPEDLNGRVRTWFAQAGFVELSYLTLDRGTRPAVGALRYDGPPRALAGKQRLFTFRR